MKLVGLTGGIGSGKSTVSELLAERGAVIIDADAITKELQQPGQSVLAQMVERFGDGILRPDGSLDRQAVADIVFHDPGALKDLNAIVHPAVAAEIMSRIQGARGTDLVVILDVPLLAENRRYPTSGVIVVDTPVDTAVERLVRHRGFREEDARARIARQATREERLQLADRVVDNAGSPEDLPAQIDEVWTWISGLEDVEPKLAEMEEREAAKAAVAATEKAG